MDYDYDEMFKEVMAERRELLNAAKRGDKIRYLVADIMRCFCENFGEKYKPQYVVQAIILWENNVEQRNRKIVRAQSFEYEKTAIFEIPEFSEEELSYLKELLTPYFDIKELDPNAKYLREFIKDEKKAFKVTLKEEKG